MILPGDRLLLAGHDFLVTAVGKGAQQALFELGHLTLVFNGDLNPCHVGAVHLSGPVPSLRDLHGESGGLRRGAMNTVLIPPGPGGYGKGLWLPTGSGKKVLSLTGREIHPVAIEIGALTESEVVNGFADIPPDNDILCVVINCAGSLRCGLYPQKGIPTITCCLPGGPDRWRTLLAKRTTSPV